MGYYFVGSRHISPGGNLPSSRLMAGRRPWQDVDVLRQLTARGDGGIDHGELLPIDLRSPAVTHPSRSESPNRSAAAAADERQKIN